MQGKRATAHNAHVAHGDITEYGGIASAYVQAWADALGVAPEAVVSAASQVPPLVDTGTSESNYESHERPTDPALRCIAWTSEDVERVRAVVAS